MATPHSTHADHFIVLSHQSLRLPTGRLLGVAAPVDAPHITQPPQTQTGTSFTHKTTSSTATKKVTLSGSIATRYQERRGQDADDDESAHMHAHRAIRNTRPNPGVGCIAIIDSAPRHILRRAHLCTYICVYWTCTNMYVCVWHIELIGSEHAENVHIHCTTLNGVQCSGSSSSDSHMG